jgi:hypothetical protein
MPIIFFGILTVVFAEVFSGSAPFWFADAWGLMVVLPLYWSHALVLFSLALRSRHTSLTHLYLYGVLFGLYESWVTKVIWAGYMGQDPGFGTFLGFAVGEFLVIALFWHAVFSFIIPILMFQIVIASSDSSLIIPSHLRFLQRTRRNQFVYLLVILTGSLFLAASFLFDVSATLIAGGANILLVILFMYVSKSSSRNNLSVKSVELKGPALAAVSLYILGLYVYMFFALLPERIPSIETIILTFAFYALVFILIRAKPPELEEEAIELEVNELLGTFDVFLYLVLFVLLSATWCILFELSNVVGSLFYLAMIMLGPALFMYTVGIIIASRARLKREQST